MKPATTMSKISNSTELPRAITTSSSAVSSSSPMRSSSDSDAHGDVNGDVNAGYIQNSYEEHSNTLVEIKEKYPSPPEPPELVELLQDDDVEERDIDTEFVEIVEPVQAPDGGVPNTPKEETMMAATDGIDELGSNRIRNSPAVTLDYCSENLPEGGTIVTVKRNHDLSDVECALPVKAGKDDTCAICFDNLVDLVCMPCCGRRSSDLRLCFKCIWKLQNSENRMGVCPICRYEFTVITPEELLVEAEKYENNLFNKNGLTVKVTVADLVTNQNEISLAVNGEPELIDHIPSFGDECDNIPLFDGDVFHGPSSGRRGPSAKGGKRIMSQIKQSNLPASSNEFNASQRFVISACSVCNRIKKIDTHTCLCEMCALSMSLEKNREARKAKFSPKNCTASGNAGIDSSPNVGSASNGEVLVDRGRPSTEGFKVFGLIPVGLLGRGSSSSSSTNSPKVITQFEPFTTTMRRKLSSFWKYNY